VLTTLALVAIAVPVFQALRRRLYLH
jgi:hypothetical protein